MKIVGIKEIMDWLSERGLLDSKGQQILFSKYQDFLHFRIPIDSGKKSVLSKVLSSIIIDQGDGLIWIDEHGIWPSSEDTNLFYRFRKSFNENSELYEKPGHFFDKNDLSDVGSLILLILYFCWGAIIVSNSGNLIIRISHDEIIDFFAVDGMSFLEIQEKIDKLRSKWGQA